MMKCTNCGKVIQDNSKFCKYCGKEVTRKISHSYTPEDLKSYWKGKYDSWKFTLNGKGEWIGYYNKQVGVLTSRTNENGDNFPDIELREPELTGGFGLNILSIGLKSFRKKK